MSPEAVLRTWGAHWKARLGGCPKERLSVDSEVFDMREGDNLADIEAMKELYPRLTYAKALDAVKYGRNPAAHPLSYSLPEMAQVELQVSNACRAVGSLLWERYWAETSRYPDFKGAPSNGYQGRLMARLGVRFLLREVFVIGTGVRGKWPGSSFDWLYPYAEPRAHMRRTGREATIGLVKDEIDFQGSVAIFEPVAENSLGLDTVR